MSSLRDEGAVDANYLIRLFLDTPAEETPNVGASLVARLAEGTIAVFQDIQKSPIDGVKGDSESRSYLVSLGRSSDRLRLWSDGYGISSGASDDLFERSCRLRGATLEILSSIGVTLTERLVASTWGVGLLGKTQLSESFTTKVEQLRELVQEAEDDISKSESSTGSSDYDDDDIIQITTDLETDTSSLMELDALFSEPILDTGHMKQSLPSSSHKWEPHEPYKHIITNRFPKADDGLITSLGKANYERFLRGQEQRNSSSRALREPVMPQEIENSDAASSKFNDSGLGSSIPSSYAETIMSYHGGEGTSIRLPSLPKSAKNGSSFLCIACGLQTLVQTNSAWKRHLFNDLRPWQCLEPSCGHKSIFSTRGDWVSHLALDHFGPEWKGAECSLCRNDTGNGKITILKHLGGHLEEISLAALPSKPDSETDSKSSDASQQDDAIGSEAEETHTAAELDDLDLPVTAANGQSAELEQEGPVASGPAMEYIKRARRTGRLEPEVYNGFLTLMKERARETISSDDAYLIMGRVLRDDLELLEDFKRLWPTFPQSTQIITGTGHRLSDNGSVPIYPTGDIAPSSNRSASQKSQVEGNRLEQNPLSAENMYDRFEFEQSLDEAIAVAKAALNAHQSEFVHSPGDTAPSNNGSASQKNQVEGNRLEQNPLSAENMYDRFESEQSLDEAIAVVKAALNAHRSESVHSPGDTAPSNNGSASQSYKGEDDGLRQSRP